MSRRALLRGAGTGAAALGALAIVGCGQDGEDARPTGTPAPAPTTPPTAGAATSPTPAARRAAWSRVESPDPAPGPRRDPSLTSDGDATLYLFGGRTRGVANAELWSFAVATNRWTRVEAPGPAPRFGHNAFFDRGRKRLVVALGQNETTFYNDVWAFDPEAAAWTQLDAASAEHPEVRYGAGGAHDAAGDRLLVSHGFTNMGRFDDTWAFDLEAGEWSRIATSGPVPIKRCLHRTLWVADRSSMLLFGGQTDGTPFLGDFWSLDPTAGAWTERAGVTAPGPRNLVGASLDGSGARWYLTGGNTPDGPTAETWVYDLAADAWAPLAADGTPPARYSLDAAVLGDGLYAFGGNDGSGDIAELWALSLPA